MDDETRQGALRVAASQGGPFLNNAANHRTPPLIELPALLTASEHVHDEVETEDDLRLLLAPGSSLGGARPKASVRDRDGQLAIAKFPHHGDQISAVLWEAVAYRLASAAGITTAVTLINEQNGDASLDLALSVAEYFRLTPTQARRIAHSGLRNYLTLEARGNSPRYSSKRDRYALLSRVV